MRRRIKTKIIASVAIIVTAALLVSGIFAYSYFYSVLKKQVMNDESIKVSQTANQLRYVQDDVYQFAQYILIDAEIQSRINSIYSFDSYERLSAEDWLRTKLNRYMLLKNWIVSVVLVDKNGKAFSTATTSNAYHSETLSENWYQNHLARNVHAGFSGVHLLKRAQDTVPVISYIIRFNPELDANSKLHQLIVHVNADYISNVLPAERSGYDGYYLLGAQNQILAGSNPAIDDPTIREPLDRVSVPPLYQGENSKQIVTINGMMKDDWKLVSVKPKSTVQREINSILYIYILIAAVTLLAILIALTPLILNMTRPLSQLANAMKEASIGRLHATVNIRSGDEIELLGEGFNRMLHDLQKYIRQSIEDEKIKQKLQFDLLMSQVNPHFIYNTLNTVIYMAQREGKADIVRMVDAFIRLLQSAVLVEGKGHQWTIEEETESVKHYLIIQNYRYPDRFQVEWQVDDRLRNCFIPRTILQPLIENALFHGIMPNPEPGKILVRVAEDHDYLRIEVEDNGVGMDDLLITNFERGVSIREAASRMRPIGLANVRDRIRTFCGPAAAMNIYRLPSGGTRIRIAIPLVQTQTAGSYTK